ncbi:unnamed protein product, partial [Rotaria magnacalcarata]
MLYSLVNVNQRLDRVVLDPLNVQYLDFVTKPFNIRNLSIHAQIFHKMRENILPRIKDKVKKLTVDPISMKFILGVVRYSQLYSLSLIDYKPKILLQYFSNDTSLHLLMNRITHMNVEGFLDDNELLVEDELNIFAMILSFSRCLIDLTYRMHYSRKYFRMSSLIISNTCCLSNALTKLTIYVNIFDDCLYLLNVSLEYLSTLIIRINKIDLSSLSKKLFKLKYFTLTTPAHTRSYNEELVPLLCRMLNLEELTLCLSVVRNNSTYVDGDELYDDVLKYMPRLNKFTFNIHTYVSCYRSIDLPSNIDIRNSFIRRGCPSIDAWTDEKFILSRNNCHVYSLPYEFDDFLFMTNCFQGGRFDKVRKILIIEAMAIHSSNQLDIEIIEEEESSTEVEYEPATASKNSISRLSSDTTEKKTISSKSKRYCKFKKEWIKISKYASFLQECRSNSSLAYCCVCKSNFSIANGGKYLIDRHLEQGNHKRLAAIEAENKSRSMFDFIDPPSKLTSMVAAELTLVYHGVRHEHSYNSQSCTVDVSKKLFHDSTIAKNISCGRTKARELAVNVL